MSTEERPRSRWAKPVLAVGLPVLTAILIAAFTPLGDRLREVLFPTSSSVSGVVRMKDRPVAGAQVDLDGERRAATEADGSFLLTEVSAGSHTLRIEALGARARQAQFVVKRRAEETDVGTLVLSPALRLAGEGSAGLVPPSNPRITMLEFRYDLTMWLEGDPDVLSRVRKVTYALPSRVRADPLEASSAGNRFCSHVAGTVRVGLGESLEAPVQVTATLDDGRQIDLSPGTGTLPPGRRPSGCP